MLFCPYCANILTIGDAEGRATAEEGHKAWVCPTCPYQSIMNEKRRVGMKTHLKIKEVDDVLGGKESWANVDKAQISCPKCEANQAYFRQLQIRSADEPMTTFYKCVDCSHQWREN